ncbi:CD244 [Cervus elaphus hippelaphus]|uniref:CD244 n=1 Tax=Cervus elaphus hippelaphus TaxID=46360 RepID=A0A212CFF1_CEREH|nr:CD244 [Cervus elaphus hippelaphus]
MILAIPKFNVTSKDFTLLIKAAQPQDSGLYTLEVTNHSGKVWTHKFQVSIFDRVERPHLVEKRKVLDGDFCRVTLSCSVARGGDVSYAWYRGTELIQTRGNLTELVQWVDVNGLHLYTCNVSNPVSWANQSLQLTQGCQSDHQDVTFLFILVSVMILLVALFLGTLIYFCVRKKRKQSRTTPEVLTIYEDVNNMRTRRNQEQKPPGEEGKTIYSTIQSQTGSKKENHSPSFNKTIYEEVGKRTSKAENPARLSRRELENFCIYS